MVQYSVFEKANMVFVYGEAHGNALEASRIYAERYPEHQCPRPNTFQDTFLRLQETGKGVYAMK